MKLLIAAPIYEGTDHCILDFVNACKSQLADEILLVDNSKSKKHMRELRKQIKGVTFRFNERERDNPMDKVADSRNIILDYAIENNFDYLLMMDADVILPKFAVECLLGHNLDVVSGIYFNNLEGKKFPPAFVYVSPEQFEQYKEIGKVAKDAQYNPNIKRYLSDKELSTRKTFQMLMPCGGCCLLSNDAFTSSTYETFEGSSDELLFFQTLRKKGFKLYTDTSLVCEHRNRGEVKG